MKIRMMTFHTPKNYGAVLQAYSLNRYLMKYSDDVKIIDFNTNHLRNKYPIIKWSFKSLKAIGATCLSLLHYCEYKSKYRKFEQFVSQMPLTKRYESYSDLYNDNIKADIFVTGSDQVFNPNRIEDERKAFYLEFVKTGKKIAYAGSFGVKNIPNDKIEEISKHINAFDNISVRERSGEKIIKDLCDRDCDVVLDPVFLTTKKEWLNICKNYSNICNKKYVLVYLVVGKIKSYNAIEKYKNIDNSKLIIISNDFRNRVKNAKYLRDVGPEEFIWLFANAERVITDSFHGVAFSIIFNKQFIFVNYDTIFADRGLNLINILDINPHICDYEFVDKLDDIYINYDEVNILKEKLISKSKDVLEKMLKC